MPFRKTPYFSEACTDFARRRKTFKRMKLRAGDRVFHSLWHCMNHGGVEITHLAPQQPGKQPAFMRKLKRRTMVCPQCLESLIFIGFIPQTEYLVPVNLAESDN